MSLIVAFPSAHQSSQVCPEAKQLLIDAGFNIIGNEDGTKLSGEALHEMIKDACAVVGGTEKYTADVLAGCGNLKTIIRYGVGTDNFDLKTMKEMGIQVGVISNCNAVAEFTIALILSELKNLPRYDAAVRDGRWDRYDMRELASKTVGIIGFGRIGKRLAQILNGFNVNILVYNHHELSKQDEEKYNVKNVDLLTLLAQSDVVTLHVPANNETQHLINTETISKMKDGAYLINTGRGALVDEKALYEALTSGKLSGAALDVFEKEPITSDNPLFELDNIVLAPHVAALTYETNYNAGLTCAKSIINVFNGGTPIYPVKL